MANRQQEHLEECLGELDKILGEILDFYMLYLDRKTGKLISKGNIPPSPKVDELCEKIEKLKRILGKI